MVLSGIRNLDLLYFLPFIVIALFFRDPPVESATGTGKPGG
jgi:hypothetical protein